MRSILVQAAVRSSYRLSSYGKRAPVSCVTASHHYITSSCQHFIPSNHIGDSRRCLTTSCYLYQPAEVKGFTAFHANYPALFFECEGINKLKTELTLFMSKARVELPPIEAGETVKLGYIQAVKKCTFSSHYGKAGRLTGKINLLEGDEQLILNDSTGEDYPWYDKHSVLKIEGPSPERLLHLEMVDEPEAIFPTNCYNILLSKATFWQRLCERLHLHRIFGENCRCLPEKVAEEPMSLINVDYEFITWLALKSSNSEDYEILRSAEWSIKLLVKYDSTQPIRQRTTFLLNNGMQEEPLIYVNNHKEIPINVLGPPSANEAVSFIWQYSDGNKPELVIMGPKYLNP